MNQAKERWERIKSSIDNLEKFTSLSDSQYSDAQGAYRIAYELSKKSDLTEDQRKTALVYILKVIELGKQGRVDPNLLYNCSTVASNLDFDYEALQLASLCAHWDGKPSYLVRKCRHEDVFGIRFQLINNELTISNDPLERIRADAWSTLLELVKRNPTYQCELVYSELHNIANRNREAGYIDDAIKAIEELAKTNDAIPSYSCVTLAGFYAARGDANWDTDFSSAVDKAIEKLSKESPGSTWYTHTKNDLLVHASLVGKTREITEKLAARGIET